MTVSNRANEPARVVGAVPAGDAGLRAPGDADCRASGSGSARIVTGAGGSALEGVTLRAVEDRGLEFLYQVYAASRQREMAQLVACSEAEKQSFLRSQFQLQQMHYRTHYPNARFDVIGMDGVPVGRLYVAPMEHEIRLMDIALLPQWRGRGIGGALIRNIMSEASRAGRYLSLHVEPDNPARRLYARLGFIAIEQVGIHVLMHWHASRDCASSD